MEKKVTKRDYYEMLKEIVYPTNADCEMTVEQGELIEFIDKQIALIDSKAEKAKARNAEKKANGDELRDIVQSLLTNELQTADAILVQIDGEDLTIAKIRARLTQLVNAGIAVKEDVKNSENKTQKAYKLA